MKNQGSHVHVSHRQFAIQQLLRQWPLALDFIFARCVSPCLWNFNIGCCANEKPLRLIAHRPFDFTFTFVSTLDWGKGGNSLNPIQASENIMILETNDCTSSVWNQGVS